MKKIRYTLFALTASAVLLMSCDGNDDGFYNEKYVDVPNLISIDAQPTYAIGDYLYVQSDFSRLLNEPGQPTPLDIFQTTGGAQGFVFTYTLEKQSGADAWSPVLIEPEMLDIVEGTAEASFFVLAHAIYNPLDETYQYNVGLPLLAAGQYRLSFGVNSDSNNQIELRSESEDNNLSLNIISSTSQLNGAGFYLFTVQ